mgnify:CR=1 FL=1
MKVNLREMKRLVQELRTLQATLPPQFQRPLIGVIREGTLLRSEKEEDLLQWLVEARKSLTTVKSEIEKKKAEYDSILTTVEKLLATYSVVQR